MTATAERDQVYDLAKTDFKRAYCLALSIDDPWFACQALASVLRYAPASAVADVNAKVSSCADVCPDDYQRGAVRAWQIRALAERGLITHSEAALECAVSFARRAEPPASRSEALELLFQAACPLGADRVVPLVVLLAETWRRHPKKWRCARALVWALAMLSPIAPSDGERILRSVDNERITGRVARMVASGLASPRPFFW